MTLSLLGKWGRWKESETNPGIASEAFEVVAWRPLSPGREIGIIYQNDSDPLATSLATYWVSASELAVDAYLW